MGERNAPSKRRLQHDECAGISRKNTATPATVSLCVRVARKKRDTDAPSCYYYLFFPHIERERERERERRADQCGRHQPKDEMLTARNEM